MEGEFDGALFGPAGFGLATIGVSAQALNYDDLNLAANSPSDSSLYSVRIYEERGFEAILIAGHSEDDADDEGIINSFQQQLQYARTQLETARTEEQAEKLVAEQAAQAEQAEKLRLEEEYRNRDTRPIGRRVDSAKMDKDRAHYKAERYAEEAVEAQVRAAQASDQAHVADVAEKATEHSRALAGAAARLAETHATHTRKVTNPEVRAE